MDQNTFYEKGLLLKQNFLREPITKTIKAKFEDTNIQIPMVVAAYRTPSMKTRDLEFYFYNLK
jgi:hypothetical protein